MTTRIEAVTFSPGGFPDGVRPQRVSLLGLPSEKGAGTAGTLMGPAALRTAGLPRLLADLGYQVVDHGDLPAPAPAMPAMDPDLAARCLNLAEITGWTRAIEARAHDLAKEGVPVFLGGDHSISMGTIAGLARHCAEIGKELVVLWLDAHADYNTPATTPSGNMHGMSLAYLCGDPALAPIAGPDGLVPLAHGNLHIFGVRSVDRDERRALFRDGVDVTDMRLIDEEGVPALLRRILTGLKGRNVHLHVSLDADFLDPMLAPGTGTTVLGGATYREAHLVMEMIHDTGLLGSLDVVELNPFLDERGRTATLLSELVASLFGLTVLHRQPA